jgi:acetyl-CoA carboxylase biotin carboxyl carrier protein
MTGTVWKIVAQIGQKIEEGDPVIILESMKMEIPVEAPKSGVVKEIRVTEGVVVQEGDVVALLE